MSLRSLNAILIIFTLLVGFAGCSGKRPAGHRTWFDLAEISNNVMKAKEDGASALVPEEANIPEPEDNFGPKEQDLSVKEGGGNPYLDQLFAQRPEVSGESLEGEGVVLNFDNADIYEVIQVIAETLDLSYILDPNIKGTVNIRSGKKIPNDQLFTIFKKLLNINGLDIRSEGDHYYIYVAGKPISQLMQTRDEIGNLKDSSRYMTQVVPVLHISSAEAQKLVEPYLTEQASIFNLPDQNTLIIADYESKIIDALMVLSRLDVSSLSALNVRLIRIEQAPLFDLKDELVEVLKALKINKTDYEGVQVLPLERVNSLMLVGYNKSLLETAQKWISELDRAPTEGRDNIYIYNVRNSVASELSELVNTLIKEKEGKTRSTSRSSVTPNTRATPPGTVRPTTTTQPTTPSLPSTSASGPALSTMQFSGEPTLIADDARNIILIRALQMDYRRIVRLLERLDNLPRQVLIEVLVAEVTLTDGWQYGIEWAIKNHQMGIHSADARLLADGSADSTFDINLTFDNQGDILRLFNLLASKTDISVLSSPQVLVLNNEAATVNVGSQVPIVTSESGSSTAGDLNRTVQYKDTGVILNVTPRINYDGIILIEVDQQVSTAATDIKEGFSSPIISTKQIKTKLAIKDGQSILMGGLIAKNTEDGESGIPLLMDIPYLGYMFKRKSQSVTQTELLIMITPYVIETEDVLEQYIRSFQEKMVDLRKEISASSLKRNK